jgi:hypothetical protein
MMRARTHRRPILIYVNKKFWENPIAYFPLILHRQKNQKIKGIHRKTYRQQSDLIGLLTKIIRDTQTHTDTQINSKMIS